MVVARWDAVIELVKLSEDGSWPEPGGVLESDPHQRGSVECLSVLDGELEVEVAGAIETARAGDTLRYRCDRPHVIRNVSDAPAHATMVCILKAAAME
jgi:mannose-6-phosphate isomerase-like protein (cupin superfamily)